MTAVLSYCLVTLREIELENVYLSHSWNLMSLCNTFTADDKYPLHNRENLPKQIQMQLSNKI